MHKLTHTDPLSGNRLFPVFLKLEQLRVLIVGGGKVGLEKLNALLHNSPGTSIMLVSTRIDDFVKQAATAHSNVILQERPFEPNDCKDADVVIIAINDPVASEQIAAIARSAGKLINVADKPELCDFYLGSIVKKGNLKIAISTNGKSPTIAKRLKEVFDDLLPEKLDDVVNNMARIRSKLNGDFSTKVDKLNAVTKILSTKKEIDTAERKWKRIATYCIFAFLFMLVGHIIFSYVPYRDLWGSIKELPSHIDNAFYWMILAGFLAQMVDGALGMGYGVTCAIVLLSIGIKLPAISGSIHTAEMFSSGVSGYSHYRFGNVNKKLFKALLIPGIIGAVAGAFLLSKYGDEYSQYLRPFLAAYTLFLGLRIFSSAFKKKKAGKKVKRVGWLAAAGGFLDSFGGGGWGPLVTSTLISKGRTPKYVIGSVSITEFFVTLASALTFFSLIGISHWQVILGLIIGGIVAAPLAARLAGKLPLKTMLISVGIMVVLWSIRILIKSLNG